MEVPSSSSAAAAASAASASHSSLSPLASAWATVQQCGRLGGAPVFIEAAQAALRVILAALVAAGLPPTN